MSSSATDLPAQAAAYKDCGHPLDITHDLPSTHRRLAADVVREMNLGRSHAAAGANGRRQPARGGHSRRQGSRTRSKTPTTCSARSSSTTISAHYLTPDFAGEYLDRYTLREPKPRMPLYHLVGALDPLTDADVVQPTRRRPAETLGEWIAYNGLTHLKIKLNGDDLAWDVERVVDVERVRPPAQAARGCKQWHYSLDFNEKCANVQYILDFLGLRQENDRRRRSIACTTSSSRRIAT